MPGSAADHALEELPAARAEQRRGRRPARSPASPRTPPPVEAPRGSGIASPGRRPASPALSRTPNQSRGSRFADPPSPGSLGVRATERIRVHSLFTTRQRRNNGLSAHSVAQSPPMVVGDLEIRPQEYIAYARGHAAAADGARAGRCSPPWPSAATASSAARSSTRPCGRSTTGSRTVRWTSTSRGCARSWTRRSPAAPTSTRTSGSATALLRVAAAFTSFSQDGHSWITDSTSWPMRACGT